jgi:oxygen-dependent protoporphyrinogen oxidase
VGLVGVTDAVAGAEADCVVVGAGIAGLSAAFELRQRGLSVTVLEAEDRVGGRIHSHAIGNGAFLNVGAHLFPGPVSVLGRLVKAHGLQLAPIWGSTSSLAYGNRVVLGGPVESVALRLPLPPRALASLAVAGIKLKVAARRYSRDVAPILGESADRRRVRVLEYRANQTFAEFLAPLDPAVEPIFRAVANRLTAEPSQITAGSGIALFAHVWSATNAGLTFNLLGGPAALPQAIGHSLGDAVQVGARGRSLALSADGGVDVRYERGGREQRVRARAVIVATTAPAARAMLEGVGAPAEEVVAALGAITYGPFVVAGIQTRERQATALDPVYAVLTARAPSTMLFNQSHVERSPKGSRTPGGSLMIYAGGGAAQPLFELDDGRIVDIYTRHLVQLFPEYGGVIGDAAVKRWEDAIPLCTPERASIQLAIERAVAGRIWLAGDYVSEFSDMESAAAAGARAAESVAERISKIAPEKI